MSLDGSCSALARPLEPTIARRAKSNADFIGKMGIVEEEADESAYWMELLIESGLIKPSRLRPLLTECNEIVAIVVASIRTARRSRR
jgi:four helix bundle protein